MTPNNKQEASANARFYSSILNYLLSIIETFSFYTGHSSGLAAPGTHILHVHKQETLPPTQAIQTAQFIGLAQAAQLAKQPYF